ncbi:MAG: carbohydrate binding family 9 domain-containing protein [Marinilabiliales bacterium]|nr:carbohydrate binding family 9 domain-containing protein [Marinilabiliales bacterium]
MKMKLSYAGIYSVCLLFVIIFSSTRVLALTHCRPEACVSDTTSGPAASPKQPVYFAVPLATSKPVVDGKLDDDCWKKGNWAGHFVQFIPNEGAKPTAQTEFNVQYDHKNLYVALRCFDSEPQKIQRYSGARDEFAGDIAGINFDSYHDRRTGFEFSVTAWGQKIDLVLFNSMNWDFNWNPVWKVKTGLEDSAWVAEYEIPLSQLRYSNEKEQVWGLHLWRWINRNQEESDWEIQSKTGPGMLYNFGELRGITGLKKSQRLEIMPYALGKLTTVENEPGNPFTKGGKIWGGNVGLDAKIGLSSNFTVDLTVNPDFGQVESDPSVMNLTAFETFYAEKRPFFLEGVTIFDYQFDKQSLFYSRRIGHAPSRTLSSDGQQFVSAPERTSILSAVKLSGTNAKGLSIGFVQSFTGNEFARVSDLTGNEHREKVEPLTSYTVMRIQKGYHDGNTVIGGMWTATNRFNDDRNLDFLAKSAYTGGLDLLHHWKDKKYYLEAKLIGSTVSGTTEAMKALQESSARYFQRPGTAYLSLDTTMTRMSGHGGKVMIGKGSKGLWKYATGVTWFSPGLELNDLGYLKNADQVDQKNTLSYQIVKPVGFFRQYSVNLEQVNSWNFGGSFLGSGANVLWTSEFSNLWNLNASFNFRTGGLDTRILRGGNAMLMPATFGALGTLNADQSKKFTGGITYDVETRALSSQSSYLLQPFLTLRPARVLKLGISAAYQHNHDILQYVTTADYQQQKRYLLGTIYQQTLGLTFRADLNLTPELSLQYYGSPFVSKGNYSHFKRVISPVANTFYGRFQEVAYASSADGSYGIDENGDGVSEYRIDNPDFNFFQFRSNLIARWEYRLGSFVYLVWSSERTANLSANGNFLSGAFRQFREIYPKNVFLIKLNYWFSL